MVEKTIITLLGLTVLVIAQILFDKYILKTKSDDIVMSVAFIWVFIYAFYVFFLFLY